MARAGAIPKHNALYAFAGTTSNNKHFFGRDQIHSFIYDHHLWVRESNILLFFGNVWEKTIRDEGLRLIYCQMRFIDILSNWWLLILQMLQINVITLSLTVYVCHVLQSFNFFLWCMKPYTIIHLNLLTRQCSFWWMQKRGIT